MDRLDKLSAWSIVILIILSSSLIFAQVNSVAVETPAMNPAVRQGAVQHSPDLDNRIKVARDLLANNNLQKAAELIGALTGEFPYDGEPFMLMGDLLMRKQDPVAAMLAYRNGIDLNPDFLDKKTPLFQGKKVKSTVLEAAELIKDGLSRNPGDTVLKEHRQTLYYMQRKIAGSCG